MSDHYQTLGVERGASADEIKKAYRKIARELHPDVNPDPAVQDKFKEVTAAYEVLSDPQKRQSYDMGGSGFGGFGGGFGGGGFSDIMDAFFGGGQNRGPRPRMRQGQDALIRVEVDLNEACFGTEREISVENAVTCTKCSGQGSADSSAPAMCQVCKGRGETQQVQRSFLGQVMTSRPCSACQGYGSVIQNPCRECAGDGRVRARQNISVKIPAGVVDGMQLKVSNKGNDAPGNSVPGDLIVAIEEIEHEFLKREGENLHYDLYISFAEAVLGISKDIEAVNGKVRIKLEEGIQSGKILRLKGKGIPSINGYGTGDLLVHVNVWTPKTLNKDQKQFFEKNLTDDNFIPNPEKSDKSFFEKVKDMFS